MLDFGVATCPLQSGLCFPTRRVGRVGTEPPGDGTGRECFGISNGRSAVSSMRLSSSTASLLWIGRWCMMDESASPGPSPPGVSDTCVTRRGLSRRIQGLGDHRDPADGGGPVVVRPLVTGYYPWRNRSALYNRLDEASARIAPDPFVGCLQAPRVSESRERAKETLMRRHCREDAYRCSTRRTLGRLGFGSR